MNTAFNNFFISKIFPVCLITLLAINCNRIPEKDWLEAIPEDVPAIVIPEKGANISAVLRSEYLPFFEDISTTSISMISEVENVPQISILLKGIVIFPTQSEDWKPLWIAESDKNLLKSITPYFEKEFAENEYDFNGAKVHILHTNEQNLYAVQLHQWILISESSYAIEEALRTYLDDTSGIDIEASNIQPNSLVMNTPYFDRWLAQAGAPRYRPLIRDIFKGTRAGVFSVSNNKEGSEKLSVSGPIPLSENKTNLIKSISHSNNEVTLDRYIPTDAAAFGIFNYTPETFPPKDIDPQTPLDSLLLADNNLYREIAESLHPSFAYVAFGASGYLSVGENLYIRQLSDQESLNQVMEKLVNEGFVERNNDTYNLESKIFADLLGSSLIDYNYFSLSITNNGAVFSQRPGLTSRVQSDRRRRRVMYYNDNYSDIRSKFPEKVSAFFYAKGNEYLDYLSPVLSPMNYTSVISSQFDVLALSLNLDNSRENVDLSLKTFLTEESEQPYRDRWIFSLDDTELTGAPVLASLGNSSNRNEILFATTKSRIYALATDGTSIFETDTGTDIPIGQPLVFDWYGNNQQAILIAAGNKIYAWNNRGEPLPNFPIEMNEQITAPLQVADVSRNGRPELIVATADRKINVLDGRGENISGWPQTTNSKIDSQPKFQQNGDSWSVWAYAENGLFSWSTNGRLQSGYPVFIESSFKGEPFFYKDNIIAAAADGNLYSIGKNKIFTDSLSREVRIETASLDENENLTSIESIYVSNSSLLNTPIIKTLNINIEDNVNIREEMFITQSANGSVFIFNTEGQLRMTQSMGQPSDENHKIIIQDINNSGSPEIIALAGFGRLYAWNSLTGERYIELPTAAMTYPIVTDIFDDGRTEIIAKTREGLRCWTILP